MNRREYSTSTSAAMDDLKEFMKSQLEEFKVDSEKMLTQTIEDLGKWAARDSAKKLTRNKAERKRKIGQAQKQENPQPALPSVLADPQLEQHRSDSFSKDQILPLDYLIAGSAMDAVDAVGNDLGINLLEAVQERNELIFSNNEVENEEIEDAKLEWMTGQAEMQKSSQPEPQLEELSSAVDAVDAVGTDLQANLEAVEERNDFISSNNEAENEEIQDAELEGSITLDGPRKSKRTVKGPAWMKDFITVGEKEKKFEDAELEDLSTTDGPRKSGRTAKEPEWMKDFTTD